MTAQQDQQHASAVMEVHVSLHLPAAPGGGRVFQQTPQLSSGLAGLHQQPGRVEFVLQPPQQLARCHAHASIGYTQPVVQQPGASARRYWAADAGAAAAVPGQQLPDQPTRQPGAGAAV